MSSIDKKPFKIKAHWDGEDLVIELPPKGEQFRLIRAGVIHVGCGDNQQIEYQFKRIRPDSASLPKANYQVTEVWNVECPHCEYEQTAPFNNKNPMQPMKQHCYSCGKDFILTYEKED